jgi:phosphoglycolate phosphatase-like HAD superfamily hydrolase
MNKHTIHAQTTKAIIFDVEGTLVDSVPAQLECLQNTLANYGRKFELTRLHKFSGMDGSDMLQRLLPDLPQSEHKEILEANDHVYTADYLATVKPIPGIEEALSKFANLGCVMAIATDCKEKELRHYLQISRIEHYLGAVCCGEEVREGKPGSGLIELAMKKLDVASKQTMMVGDTPSDAIAAFKIGVDCNGVLTGGFSEEDLRSIGCIAVYSSVLAMSASFAAQLVKETGKVA